MTLPYPAPTDPMADAALHIRNLAEGVENRLPIGLHIFAFDSGPVTLTNPDGSWGTAIPTSKMTQLTGAICQSRYDSANGTDAIYVPTIIRDEARYATDMWFNCWDAPSKTRKAGKKVRLIGLGWGPLKVTAADAAPLAVPPGTLFPPGQTAHNLRYPGTDQAQFRTAESIGLLADDIGAALGGASVAGLTIAVWAGTITGDSTGWCGQMPEGGGIQFGPENIGQVQGAAVMAVDATGAYKQTRIFNVNIPSTSYSGNDPQHYFSWCGVWKYDNQYKNYPNELSSRPNPGATGVVAIAWGTPPGQYPRPSSFTGEVPDVAAEVAELTRRDVIGQ